MILVRLEYFSDPPISLFSMTSCRIPAPKLRFRTGSLSNPPTEGTSNCQDSQTYASKHMYSRT